MNGSLNLMPASSLRRRIKSETIWLWSRVLVVIGAVAATNGLFKAWQREEARQRTSALTAQHQPVQQLRVELDRLQSTISELNRIEALPLAIGQASSMLSLLACVVDSAKTFRGEAYLDSLEYDAGSVTNAAGDPPQLLVKGVARDPAAMQNFVQALQATGGFREVRLDDTQARLLRGTATTVFEVVCYL